MKEESTPRTVVTLEDLLAMEQRLMRHIDACFAKQAAKPEQIFYKPAEVAAMVGLGVHAIRHKLRNPEEKYLKGIQESGVRGSWLIPKESVQAWLASMKKK